MGGAQHTWGFVPGPDTDPEADGDATLGGHALSDDADSAGQDAAANLVTPLALVDKTAGAVVKFFGNLFYVKRKN